jgi:hypothetical protein
MSSVFVVTSLPVGYHLTTCPQLTTSAGGLVTNSRTNIVSSSSCTVACGNVLITPVPSNSHVHSFHCSGGQPSCHNMVETQNFFASEKVGLDKAEENLCICPCFIA